MASGRRTRPPGDPPTSSRRARAVGRRNERSDLGARVITAVPAIAFAIFIVYEGGWVFAVGVGALGCICLHELFELYARVHPARLAGMLSVIGMVVAAAAGGPRQVLLVLVASVPLVFVLVLAAPRRTNATASMSLTLLGILWIGLAVSHAVLLRGLPHGGGIVVDVLVGTFIGDTGAYIGGRAFGRRPLAPTLSPNKTVEGLVVGVLSAVAAVWFAGLYQVWLGGGRALELGLAVAVVAPLGDLFESLVKRD
ncbi:MAG TPA: phosphatidate cytidylyltransferase, partial [Solirubrobacteraceae bacterium]|nr:phosphatidate cytidylyltransferase [Solirubrobacteraceae bacterium]